MDIETQLVTLGRSHEEFGSVNPPVYRASTILFDDFDAFMDAYHGKVRLWYGRQGNPTIDALSNSLSRLIDADFTLLTASGLLAITIPILAHVRQGDHVLVSDSVYGPTRAFCDKVLHKMGITTTYYDPEITPDALKELFQPTTRILFLESPGSMTFEVQDIRGLCEVAKARECVTMLDYTWASPIYIKPFELGVDIAIQAVTKYVGGHSDVVMGAISCKEVYCKAIAQTGYTLGNYVSGDEASLALRGLRTIQIRMEKQFQHCLKVAQWMGTQNEYVAEIRYPALEGSRGHHFWKRDMSGASALFGVVLKPEVSEVQVRAFANQLNLFGMGFSWGGYESLLVPFKPKNVRTATTATWQEGQWCLRIHIGLESPDDLIADLQNGFNAMRQPVTAYSSALSV